MLFISTMNCSCLILSWSSCDFQLLLLVFVGFSCKPDDHRLQLRQRLSSLAHLAHLFPTTLSPGGQKPKLWPRPQTFGLGLASITISLSYYVIGHFSGKNRVKFGNFVNFSSNNLRLYVVNHYLVLFHSYFWPRPWPQPPEIGLGLVALGLGLEVLASFNITVYFILMVS